ncbi:MAG: GNAT family N-acetyltransferase [Flavobacteriaceae bacterium]
MTLRPIENKDNPQMAALLRAVLIEMGVPKTGTAYEDPELDCMYEAYQNPKSAYYIIEVAGALLGGAGIAPLHKGPEGTCELQKMYFSSKARGKGWGAIMMDHCLTFAKAQGFDHCYIETLPSMTAAQKLYIKSGFTYLKNPMGKTGHTNCSVWMIKTL